MKTKFKAYLIALALLLTPGANCLAQISGFDQVGTTSFQFLQVVPNARMAALGTAGSAVFANSEAVFFNPAGLAMAPKLDASVSYLDWFLDVQVTSFSLSWNMDQLGSFGVQAGYVDLGEVQETRVDNLLRDPATGLYNPGLTGNTLTASALVVGLSYAKSLTDKFSFGITAKYAYEDLVAETGSAIIFDGGILYRTGFKSLTLGTMLRNFGPEVKYFDESYPLPQTFSIGVSGMLMAPNGAFLMENDQHKVMAVYDLAQTRDHSQQQHLGAEYSFLDFLYLRGGYKFNFDEEGMTLGAGVKARNVSIDYAYNDFGEFLDNVQRFTINFDLN